jgi:hypothetical protein
MNQPHVSNDDLDFDVAPTYQEAHGRVRVLEQTLGFVEKQSVTAHLGLLGVRNRVPNRCRFDSQRERIR